MQMLKQHDHQRCIESALQSAQQICQERGLRLTPLRRQVLELVWQSHIPLGAYNLMDMLADISNRKHVAPPTVYRALDFLVAQGLIHRVHSLNAFIGCSHPKAPHSDLLFICQKCHTAMELHNTAVSQAIQGCASEQQFVVSQQMLEVVGTCEHCRIEEKNNHD